MNTLLRSLPTRVASCAGAMLITGCATAQNVKWSDLPATNKVVITWISPFAIPGQTNMTITFGDLRNWILGTLWTNSLGFSNAVTFQNVVQFRSVVSLPNILGGPLVGLDGGNDLIGYTNDPATISIVGGVISAILRSPTNTALGSIINIVNTNALLVGSASSVYGLTVTNSTAAQQNAALGITPESGKGGIWFGFYAGGPSETNANIYGSTQHTILNIPGATGKISLAAQGVFVGQLGSSNSFDKTVNLNYELRLANNAGSAGKVVSSQGSANYPIWDFPFHSTYSGSSQGNSTAAGVTHYYTPNGSGFIATSDAAGVTRVPVTRTSTAKTLYVVSDTAAGVGETYTVTLMTNGVASNLSAVLSNATSGNDNVNSVNLSPGDQIGIKIVASGGAATAKFAWAMEVDAR